MEIINKYSISSPNLSNQIPSFSSLDKYIPFVALLKRIALPVSRTCFNYWNISVSFSNISQPIKRKSIGVNCEGLVLVHVVDICPYGV